MKIYLTVSVDHSQIDENQLLNFRIFNFGDVYLKYGISIMDKEKYENRQKCLAKEISLINENILVIGNPCYNTRDIKGLNKKMLQNNQLIDRIYIPSDQNIQERKKMAYEEHIKYNRLLGTSDEEIERNYHEFESAINEIENFGKENNIETIRV